MAVFSNAKHPLQSAFSYAILHPIIFEYYAYYVPNQNLKSIEFFFTD